MFIVHDLYASGNSGDTAPVLCFAYQVLDADMMPQGEAKVLYCRPRHDLLPSPYLIREGFDLTPCIQAPVEFDFAHEVSRILAPIDATQVGWGLSRTDSARRHLFYRNLIHPYDSEFEAANTTPLWKPAGPHQAQVQPRRADLEAVIWQMLLKEQTKALGLELPTKERRGVRQVDTEWASFCHKNGVLHTNQNLSLAKVASMTALLQKLHAANPVLLREAIMAQSKGELERMVLPSAAANSPDPVQPFLLIDREGGGYQRRVVRTLLRDKGLNWCVDLSQDYRDELKVLLNDPERHYRDYVGPEAVKSSVLTAFKVSPSLTIFPVANLSDKQLGAIGLRREDVAARNAGIGGMADRIAAALNRSLSYAQAVPPAASIDSLYSMPFWERKAREQLRTLGGAHDARDAIELAHRLGEPVVERLAMLAMWQSRPESFRAYVKDNCRDAARVVFSEAQAILMKTKGRGELAWNIDNYLDRVRTEAAAFPGNDTTATLLAQLHHNAMAVVQHARTVLEQGPIPVEQRTQPVSVPTSEPPANQDAEREYATGMSRGF